MKDQPLTIQEVEPLVNGALVMTAQEQTAQRENRRKWGMRFLWALALCAVEIGLLFRFGQPWFWREAGVFVILPPLMALIFGFYVAVKVHLILVIKSGQFFFREKDKVQAISPFCSLWRR